MYVDGLIGNQGILETLGSLTAGVYNYMRAENQAAFKLQDIIPRSYDYLYPPLSEEEKANQVNTGLMNFVKTAPNVPSKLYKG